MRSLLNTFYAVGVIVVMSGFLWGFFAHQRINELAVFTLPPEMIGFYKKNIEYVREHAVDADKRRYAVVDEAPRHYIDLDQYGDSALFKMPRRWKQAVEKYSEDTLKAHGIVPWHIHRVYGQLRDAFMVKDPERILKLSADIGHYIGDAHVPLHTTKNHNGQFTGQDGIHGFWESRLPELFSSKFNYLVGKASYIEDTQLAAWKAVESAHLALDSVLRMEKELSERLGGRKYSFETKGRQTVKVFSQEYSEAYHEMLSGMVERQMRRSIRAIGNFWFSAWVDAGQPDLNALIKYAPSEEEIAQRRKDLAAWKQKTFSVRPHEDQ